MVPLQPLLALLLGLPLLLAASCTKPEPEPEAVLLPAELKAYTLFQPGTYWVYQDSASRQLDSVWVVSTELSILRLGRGGSSTYPSMKHEDFRLRTRSSRGGPDYIYRVDRNCGLPIQEDVTSDGYPCWVIRRGLSLPNSTADEGATSVFPYRIARNEPPTGYLLGVMKPYWHTAPLTLGNTTYADVLEVKIPISDRSEYGWPAHYYWAPYVGIVRLRTFYNRQPRTWTLLRSHIVQ